jgi:RES domain-containing protein
LTTVYRLIRSLYADNPFDGEGAYRYGGRWSSVGTRVAYTSQHQSLAMLEYFVHLDRDNPPTDLVLARAIVPDRLSRIQVAVDDLPLDWHSSPAPSVLAAIGDDFVAGRKAAILIVPSALAPPENNWLLNPYHPEFAKIEVQPVEAFEHDERLFA